MVAAQDQHELGAVALEPVHVLAHGVRGALIPVVAVVVGLLGREDLYEAVGEGVEPVGPGDVGVERR